MADTTPGRRFDRIFDRLRPIRWIDRLYCWWFNYPMNGLALYRYGRQKGHSRRTAAGISWRAREMWD